MSHAVFFDGWQVLRQQYAAILAALALAFLASASVMGMLRAAGARLRIDDGLALAAVSWPLPAVFAAALILALGSLLDVRLVVASVLFALSVGASWLFRRTWASVARSISGSHGIAFGALLAIVALLMPLRLAFVEGLALPLYIDSASHYTLIRQLLEWSQHPGAPLVLTLPFQAYYHLGYHVLVAASARVGAPDIATSMLISGQLMLALLPVSLYVLVHKHTGSMIGGLTAVLLAALGWYMPAHAVNWGKYPALFAMFPAVATSSFALLSKDASQALSSRRTMIGLAIASALVAGLVHTRAVIVLGIGLTAWVLAGWVIPLAKQRRWGMPMAGVAPWLIVVGVAFAQPSLQSTLDPYAREGIWMTTVVIVLSFPAMLKFPRMSLTALLSVLLLLSSTLMAVPLAGVGMLLDRPLVEIWLSVPLALLGGLGLAALFAAQPATSIAVRLGVTVALAILIAVNASARYSMRPADCCRIVGSDDLVALDWMRRTQERDAIVATAYAPLSMGAGVDPLLEAPADAGAWVEPLTALRTVPLPWTSNLGASNTISRLCSARARLVYVGGGEQSFDRATLEDASSFYRPRLLLPGAAVYELFNCPG